MRILVAHNFYLQPGGEDAVFQAECDLLERHGHHVVRYAVSNEGVRDLGRLGAAVATVWNRQAARDLADVLRRHRPDVAHFHNTFPLLSPAAYAAARDAGAAVVQTLHNFRLLAPCAILFRDGRVCRECVGRTVAWRGVVRGCYRASRAATAVVAAATAAHRALGTYRHAVDAYITPSDAARRELLCGGLPAEKLHVKPNFVDPDPGAGPGDGGYALFVGRFSAGKGVETLLQAWTRDERPAAPLKVVGDGDLAPLVRRTAETHPQVDWVGRKSPAEVMDLLGRAAVAVVPSECFETFGRVVVEAFAKGTPVVAADRGGVAELVTPGRTGELFAAGDPADLARKVREVLADPSRMRARCREEFEAKYTAERNLELLAGIYRRALAQRHRGHPRPAPAREAVA